jgi:hypothetical protein
MLGAKKCAGGSRVTTECCARIQMAARRPLNRGRNLAAPLDCSRSKCLAKTPIHFPASRKLSGMYASCTRHATVLLRLVMAQECSCIMRQAPVRKRIHWLHSSRVKRFAPDPQSRACPTPLQCFLVWASPGCQFWNGTRPFLHEQHGD